MMDFSLSEEQKRLFEKARDFATKEIKPVAIEFDKEGTYSLIAKTFLNSPPTQLTY